MNSYPDAQKHLPCGALGPRKEAASGKQRGAHRAGRGGRGMHPARRPGARQEARPGRSPRDSSFPLPSSAAASQVIPGT